MTLFMPLGLLTALLCLPNELVFLYEGESFIYSNSHFLNQVLNKTFKVLMTVLDAEDIIVNMWTWFLSFELTLW